MRPALSFAILLAAWLLPSARAQLIRSHISGTVLDSSGAGLAGVRVAAKNVDTNLGRQTLTDDAGLYRLPALEPGTYDIEFSREGFQQARASGIVVNSTHEAVVNHTLGLAAHVSNVLVEARPTGVELSKASAAIDRSIGPEVAEKVPLTDARDVTYLMALGPTAVRVPGRPEFNYTASGQSAGRIEFLADGLDNRSTFDFPDWRPQPEQIAELHVKSNAYSAEFGRTSGVVVSAISRSGGNELHGTAWDYYSGSWISAQTLGNKRLGLPLPRFHDHQAGFNLGGPIRKNSTFFFSQLQVRTLRSGPGVSNSSSVVIPTPQGFDALTRVPLGAAQSPQNRAAVLSTLGFLGSSDARFIGPKYTLPVNGVPIPIGTAFFPVPQRLDVLTGLGRIDHRLSERDQLCFRWQGEHWQEDFAQGGRAAASNTGFGEHFGSNARFTHTSGMASHTRLISPGAVNEFRFGSILNPFETTPVKTPSPLVSNFETSAFGTNPISPIALHTLALQLQNVTTVHRGSRWWKFGADIRRNRRTADHVNFTRGFWLFLTLQDLVNNNPLFLEYQRQRSEAELVQVQQAYFAQGDLRVSHNLTLQVGVRYQTAGTPLGQYGTLSPELQAAGIPRPMVRDRNDWAPRAGFAWSLGLRTVLRGGFGIAYEQSPGPPVTYVSYPESARVRLYFPFQQYPRIPEDGPARPNLPPSAYSYFNPAPDAMNPTTHFYSLSVQQQYGSYVLEAGYTGNRAYHLWRYNERNPVIAGVRFNPAWESRAIHETAGSSNYNAGYARIDRRFESGLLFGLNYTWSAVRDYGDGPPQDVFNFRSEYARANIDRPHRVSGHFVWTTPRVHKRWMAVSVGGWQFAGYAECQSGEPFTITTGLDSNGDAVSPLNQPGIFTDRPDFNPAGILRLDPVSADWRTFSAPLDRTGVFVSPGSPNRLGSLGRNTFRGPGYVSANVSILREFQISERGRMELRASWTNLFNHRNFGPPVSVMNRPDFGSNSSTPESRVMILAAKLRF